MISRPEQKQIKKMRGSTDDPCRRSKHIYWILLLVRFVFIFCFGYIHPDEFFQSPSVASSVVFGGVNIDNNSSNIIPWEFREGQRCIVFPMIVSGIPFKLIEALLNHAYWSYSMLLAPRLLLFLVSIVVDECVVRIIYGTSLNRANEGKSNTLGKKIDPVMLHQRYTVKLLYASLWPTLLFHTRTFSNTLEAFVLVWLVMLCCGDHSTSNEKELLKCITIGVLSAVGLFVRFTFPMFAFPYVAYYLFINVWRRNLGAFRSSMIQSLKYLSLWVVGFCSMSSILIWCDSVYYGQWAITPLNNLLYNMKADNLALHTLHPRHLHLLVNMPMLYGPLFIGVVFKLVQKCNQILHYRSSLFWTSLASIIMGVGCLSLAPHQEPRFLLPCSLPLIVLYSYLTRDDSSRTPFVFKLRMILTFSLIMAVFFGVVHQAGVIPSLLKVESELKQSTHAIHVTFEGTYMPPMYLLLSNKEYSTTLKIVDAQGSMNNHTCEQVLERICPKESNGASSNVRHLLVSNRYTQCFPIVDSMFPHVSTEDLSSTIRSHFSLYLLSIPCNAGTK